MERAINWLPWEVEAHLRQGKRQSRRVLDPQPPAGYTEALQTPGGIGWKFWKPRGTKYDEGWPRGELDYLFCPLGKPGDTLWVREDHWVDRREPGVVVYDATPEWGKYRDQERPVRSECPDGRLPTREESRAAMLPKFWSKRPAQVMERWASRFTLRITGVRLERLQNISGGDALDEGFSNDFDDPEIAISDFVIFWEAKHLWYTNPWVWVVEHEEAA